MEAEEIAHKSSLSMNSLNKLSELFARFPGIGQRQSKRFVYFLLSQPKAYRTELAGLIASLESNVAMCTHCFRYFTRNGNPTKMCALCSDHNRNQELLTIVEKDVDIDAIERAGTYEGLYVVLGGTIPILEKKPEEKIKINELLKRLETDAIRELILALSATTEGDNTTDYVLKTIAPITEKKNIKVSTLGRGLSTGSEIEYADKETLKNALKNRG